MSLRLVVGIATRGRPQVLAETIADIGLQSRRPERIIVSYADAVDVGDAPERFPDVRFIQSRPGLTRQRNTILDAVEEEDVIIFLDDDFLLQRGYLHYVERVFVEHLRVIAATGKVLADGVNGPGLDILEARQIIATAPEPGAGLELTARFNAYGCNMSLRLQPIRDHQLRFDENLPLYGWYEDVDFSRQLAPYGDIVRVESACGVHLGTKSGRQPGLLLGYSQVANPVYLARKRSVSWAFALASMTSRSAKNLVRSPSPEPYVDRRGRLRGNLRGWREFFSGAISPTRILDF